MSTSSLHHTPPLHRVDNTDARRRREDENRPRSRWNGYTVTLLVAGVVATAAFLAFTAVCVKEYIRYKWDALRPLSASLRARVSQMFGPELADLIERIRGHDANVLIRRMALTSEDEQRVLRALVEEYEVSEDQLKEIINGAHVVLLDEGEQYHRWEVELERKHTRTSSHDSTHDQYAIRGRFVSELLFSRAERAVDTSGQKHQVTWFQIEGHPINSVASFVLHMRDYFRYRVTGKNQSPYGSSRFTEANPLILRRRSLVSP